MTQRRKCLRWTARAAAAILALTTLGPARATTYYVDSIGGSDGNGGTSETDAWQSLAPVNSFTFQPGDRVRFRSGGIWTGQLWPKGSGADGNPIVLDAYGTGPAPIIEGAGTNHAVKLYNQPFWELHELEITNVGPGTNTVRDGVYIGAEDVGALRGVRLSGLHIHDVAGTLATKHNGGIHVDVNGFTVPTWYDGLIIEKCHVHDVVNTGISNTSTWSNEHSLTNRGYLNENFIIRSNRIVRTAQNGLIVRVSDGALVEHNTLNGCANAASGNAMFLFHCNNTVVQSNEIYGTVYNPGDEDASAFDSDYQCLNSVFQYNYSHDNDGGFMAVACDGSDPFPVNFNVGTIVRYNVSVNDAGAAGDPKEAVIRVSGTPTGTRIHNNTVYLASNMTSRVVLHRSWFGWSDDTRYHNNIFYNLGSGDYDLGESTRTVFDYNVFHGNHPPGEPADVNAFAADPLLVSPGWGGPGRTGLDGYRLQAASPVIDRGLTVTDGAAGDFWGNPLHDGGVDMGAHERPVGSPPPPLAPTNTLARAVSGTQADVTWKDVADDEDGFELARRTGDGAFPVIAWLPTDTTNYHDSGLTTGTDYTYAVRTHKGTRKSLFAEAGTLTMPGRAPETVWVNADAFVRGGAYAATNYGSRDELTVRLTNDEQFTRRAFLRFDMSAVSGSVDRVALRLNVQGVDYTGGEEAVHNVRFVADDTWMETLVTWSNQPAAGAVLDSYLVPSNSAGEWVEFDVTPVGSAASLGDGQLSLCIEDTTKRSTVDYHSRESTDATNRPHLLIHFRTDHGTPYSWLERYHTVTNSYEAPDLADYDGDGAAGWEEHAAGTDPTDETSVFRIVRFSTDGGIVWLGGTNGDDNPFLVYRTTDLVGAAPWGAPAASVPRLPGIGVEHTWQDPVTGSAGRAFYSVGAEAGP